MLPVAATAVRAWTAKTMAGVLHIRCAPVDDDSASALLPVAATLFSLPAILRLPALPADAPPTVVLQRSPDGASPSTQPESDLL